MPNPKSPSLLRAALEIAASCWKEWGPTAALSGVVVVAGALVVLLLPSPVADGSRSARAAAELAALEQQLAEEEALADLSVDGGATSLRIPSKPAPWQKPPPCQKEMGERAINGACYFRMHPEDMRPPCLAPAMEHQDERGERFCYRAIARAPKLPSSVEE